jgi:hypothetical protein
MTRSPEFPQNNKTDRPPFLNDGITEVEFQEGMIVDGPPNDPIPAYVFNLKVLKSSNPMNQVNGVHTVRVKCRGFSWGDQVKEIIGKAGLLPGTAINTQVAEALLASGKLKGRKFAIEMVTKSGPKKNQPGVTVSWREYKCAAMESTPVI